MCVCCLLDVPDANRNFTEPKDTTPSDLPSQTLPITWFTDGTLNACYNCVDRHAIADPNKVAIIYEADEPGEHQ